MRQPQNQTPVTAKKAVGPKSPRRRRPETGGWANSDNTRAGIVAVALEVFGEMGFDNASTRAIAGRAGVSLPVLAYHFGGKAGLYQACADHITAQINVRLGPGLSAVEKVLVQRDLPRQELIDLLLTILTAMMNTIAQETEARPWVGIIIREQSAPTAVFDTIYEGVMSKVIKTISTIIGRLLGQSADAPEVRLRALGCLGQVLMLRNARAAFLRTMGWQDFRQKNLALIQAVLRAQLEAAFRPESSPRSNGRRQPAMAGPPPR